MSRRRGKEKKGDDDEAGGRRPVFFFHARAGVFRKVYNTNVTCNVLLDAIKADAMRELQSMCKERFSAIDQALSRIAEVEATRKVEQDLLLAEKRSSRPGSALVTVDADAGGDGDVAPEEGEAQSSSRKSAREDRKDRDTLEKKKKTGKESGRKRGKSARQVEEVAAVVQDPLVTEKSNLLEERAGLEEECTVLATVNAIELCDAEGTPMNLRERAEEYAYHVLKPAAQYDIASLVTGGAEPQYTPIAVPCLERTLENLFLE
jgi:hypothetical protein